MGDASPVWLVPWIGAVAPDRADDPVGYLAVKTSHPGWIVAAVSESLGEEPVTGLPLTEEALAANGIRPRVTLCAVPGLAAPADLVARGSQAARWSPFGAFRVQDGSILRTGNRRTQRDKKSYAPPTWRCGNVTWRRPLA